MEIICINSVKGGSGKTTVSLAILYNRIMNYLTAEEHHKIRDIPPKRFAYVDLDLQGTGVSRLIYDDNERRKIKFYNDFDYSKEKYVEYKNIFPQNGIGLNNKHKQIDAYLLNDSDDAKTLYGVKNNEMLEKRNVNRFKEKAIGIIEQIIQSEEYYTIVLDNAPSYDYISADIFKYICQKYSKEARIINAFVSTLEKSQIYTTISKVSNILRKGEYNLGLYIICNDVNGYFGSNNKDKHAFKESIFKQIRGAESEVNGLQVSPLSFSTEEEQGGFGEDRIVILDRLDICNQFVYKEENTLNQKDMVKKLTSDNIVNDMKLHI